MFLSYTTPLTDKPFSLPADAIIRVKPGRMRNNWFPYNLAEYMTRDRFRELGLTDAAIGVRDRTFGNRLAVDQETIIAKAKAREQRRQAKKAERPPVIPIMQVSSVQCPSFLPHSSSFSPCIGEKWAEPC